MPTQRCNSLNGLRRRDSLHSLRRLAQHSLRTLFCPVACAVCLTAAVSGPAAAQSAAVEGVVADPDARVILGATVVILNAETGYERTVTTDPNGRYFAAVVPVGTYSIIASAAGFVSARQEGVRLTIGLTERVDLSLRAESIEEKVNVPVKAPPTAVDTEQGTTGTIIGRRAVADLPIRGRDFTEFVQLAPAITQESDRSGMVLSGQRSINSNIAIDGSDFNDALQGNQRGGNEGVFFFPQSAILEFQVVRSGATADVGRTNGGFVNVATKSGTNVLHGESFYFNRNKALTSSDAFGRTLNNQQSQFGGAVGGPVARDRAFFFGAVEQSLLRVPFIVEFPDQAPGVTVPAELLALQGEQSGTNHPTAIFGRTDVQLGVRSLLNIQATDTRLRGENFNFDGLTPDQAASTNYTRQSSSTSVKGGVVSVLTPFVIHELRAQVATDDRKELPNVTLPLVTINGFGNIGGDSGRPRVFNSTRYQITDTVTWARGGHDLRFGVDANLNDVQQQREDNIQGRYDFKSLGDYVARRISRYRQTVLTFSGNEPFFRGTQRELAFYAQGKIVLRPVVTLTAGLRWEGQWNPQPTSPNPAIPQTARIPNDLGQWQPRVGLAWDASGTGTTIVRVSAGVYDARTPATLFQRVFTDNGITTIGVDSRVDPKVLSALVFPNPLQAVPVGIQVAPPRVFGFDPDFRNPRSVQASATIDRRVGDTLTLSVGYTHNSTFNLQRRVDRNLFPPTIDATGMPVFPTLRPNPSIGWLSINESTAHSQYDALVVAATSRLANRLEVQANYTLGRNLDDDSNEHLFRREPALNPFDLAAEWSYAKNDVRHNLTINGFADLPVGFTVGAILVTRSGAPYTPIIGFDTQNDGNDENDRAIINGRVAGRNSFRQPSFFNLDIRLLKAFRFGGGPELDLITEVFNVTRATNKNFGPDAISVFGTPSQPVATAGQPLFAPSTARFGGPRQVQLGVRVVF